MIIFCIYLILKIFPREPTSGRRIIYCVYEYDPLLDSSNMTVDDYANLSIDIKVLFDHSIKNYGTTDMIFICNNLTYITIITINLSKIINKYLLNILIYYLNILISIILYKSS